MRSVAFVFSAEFMLFSDEALKANIVVLVSDF